MSDASSTKATRSSSFELLRIISMLLIVMHHFSVHGGYFDGVSAFNQSIIDAFATGGKLGVNIFILITGYFMVSSKFKMSKLIQLVLQVTFYSTLLYLVLLGVGVVEFSGGDLANSILSVTTDGYWFMSTYLVLYALTPFINKLINACSFKELVILVVFLYFIQLEIPYVINNFISNVGWFIMLYIIGGMIRLYPNKLTGSLGLMLPVSLITFFMMFLLYPLFGFHLHAMQSPICVICAVSTFITFKNIKMKNSRVINFISSTTLGIYLIHDNDFVRPWLWRAVLRCPERAMKDGFLLFAVISVLIVFVVCMIIDILRIYLFTGISNLFKKRQIKAKASL